MSYVSNETYSKEAYDRIRGLGNRLRNLIWDLDDWGKDEPYEIPNLVKHKAYMLLSSLILCKNFKWPNTICPTLRESVQFKWDYYKDSVEWYYEIEVFEDKVSMMLAWRQVYPKDQKYGELNSFSYTLLDEDNIIKEPFPMNVHLFFEMYRVKKDENVLKILELFTMKIQKE